MEKYSKGWYVAQLDCISQLRDTLEQRQKNWNNDCEVYWELDKIITMYNQDIDYLEELIRTGGKHVQY